MEINLNPNNAPDSIDVLKYCVLYFDKIILLRPQKLVMLIEERMKRWYSYIILMIYCLTPVCIWKRKVYYKYPMVQYNINLFLLSQIGVQILFE